MERLIELWDKKEKLRGLSRQDRENIILQAQFGKTCEEWGRLFPNVLNENGIGTKRTISGITYFDMNMNHIIDTKELQIRLKDFLDGEFVERISFDL
ncbi:hypothetical protein [Peribacillus sp. Hz7]|uniref:hypothetical protein n=1 Tax=Peribacillus sp. Hz7 TaxID=3344873 RepID=UPI0035CAD74E